MKTFAGRSAEWWRHRLFQVGVVLKGLDGVFELAGGLLLGVFGSSGLNRAITFLTQHELSEDPGDAVARWLVTHTRNLGASTVQFATAYLLAHGLVKVVLSVGLIRERLGVFPAALAFLGVFILYQAYRLALAPSWELAYLTVLDLIIMVLVWREYRALRQRS